VAAEQVRGAQQDVARGEHLWTRQRQRLARVERDLERLGERKGDVVDRDRLAAVVEPPRQDHDRQPRRQVPHDPPALAAAADHHRRLKLERRDLAGAQDLPRAKPALEVSGGRAVRADAAEIDDAGDPGSLGSAPEGERALSLDRGVALTPGHAVDQIKRGLTALHRRLDGGLVGDLEPPEIVLGQRQVSALRVARAADHAVAEAAQHRM
jgi:hypothetical protein